MNHNTELLRLTNHMLMIQEANKRLAELVAKQAAQIRELTAQEFQRKCEAGMLDASEPPRE